MAKAVVDSQVISEAFTELAPQYEATVDGELRKYWALSYSEFVNRVIAAAAIKAGDVVLDVATGTGRIPLGIGRQVGDGCRTIGLDITPAMLQHGREKIEQAGSSANIHLVCASAMAIPFTEAGFDVVICGLGTHHMDVPGMLSEMRRVLKPGGRLVMVDVAATAFWRSVFGDILLRLLLMSQGLVRGDARAEAEVEAFGNFRSAGEWSTLLAECGFVEIEVNESRARRPWYPGAVTMKARAGPVRAN